MNVLLIITLIDSECSANYHVNCQGEGDEEEEEEQEDLFENVTRQSKRTAVLDNKLRHVSLYFQFF